MNDNRSVWNNVFSNQEWGKYPPLSLIRFVAKNFYHLKRSSIKILEIGCGPGANIWYLSREGFESYGIDCSEVAIEKASAFLAKEKLTANLTSGDISSLPYQADFFDAVIDVECLYCNPLNSLDGALREIRRVLKPQGLFYSITFASTMVEGSQKEFDSVESGPLKGKGFVRLSSEKDIHSIYGERFELISTDFLSSTFNNQSFSIDEWSIVARKNN